MEKCYVLSRRPSGKELEQETFNERLLYLLICYWHICLSACLLSAAGTEHCKPKNDATLGRKKLIQVSPNACACFSSYILTNHQTYTRLHNQLPLSGSLYSAPFTQLPPQLLPHSLPLPSPREYHFIELGHLFRDSGGEHEGAIGGTLDSKPTG